MSIVTLTLALAAAVVAIASWRARRHARVTLEWTGRCDGLVRNVRRMRVALLAVAGLAAVGSGLVAMRDEADGRGRLKWPTPPLMVVMDVSRSMTATDVDPSRGLLARTIVARIISEADFQVVGLIAVAGEATLVCPPTSDRRALQLALSELPRVASALVGGSDLRAGIALAANTLGGSRGLVVLLSDGESTVGGNASDAAPVAPDLTVHVVGVGTAGGAWIGDVAQAGDGRTPTGRHFSRLNEVFLRSLAAAHRGQYFAATDREAVTALASRLRSAAAAVDSPSQYRHTWLLGLVVIAVVAEQVLAWLA